MHKLILCYILPLAFSLNSCSIESGDSKVCFIGDSITELWDLEYFFPNLNIHKHAVGGATLKYTLPRWNLDNCEGIKSFLLIGTNDVGNFDLQDSLLQEKQLDFADLYAQRAKEIKASPLIVIGILPRKSNGQDSTINIALEKQNSLIQQSLTKKQVEYEYIDMSDAFMDDNYNLEEQYFKDGVHPTIEGYYKLAAAILEKL